MQKITSTEQGKTTAFVGRVMFTVFWDVKGMVHTGFMPTGRAINFELYFETLGTLSMLSSRVHPHMEEPLSINVTMLDYIPTSAREAADIQHVCFTILDHPPYTPDLAVQIFICVPS